MVKLTFFQRLAVFFGYRYFINNKTKEIHDLKNKHHNCHIELASKNNTFYATEKDKQALSTFYDGCRWCMKEESKD